LRPWFEMAVLRHPCLESALCTILAQRFASPEMPAREWRRACEDVLLNPPPGYDEMQAAKTCAATSACPPDGTKKSCKTKSKRSCSYGSNGKTSNNSGCSGGGGGSSSQGSSCENLAFVAVESLKATASMESFSAMAALAEARANEWPPVEGEWQVRNARL